MLHVVVVSKDKLQGVGAGSQCQVGFSLAIAKMFVIVVLGNGQSRIWNRGIDQQVMVPGGDFIAAIDEGRSHSHSLETEHHGERSGDGFTILGRDDVELGIIRPFGLSGSESFGHSCRASLGRSMRVGRSGWGLSVAVPSQTKDCQTGQGKKEKGKFFHGTRVC